METRNVYLYWIGYDTRLIYNNTFNKSKNIEKYKYQHLRYNRKNKY
jgi:hypothetical protein